jgi:hypothetical protein
MRKLSHTPEKGKGRSFRSSPAPVRRSSPEDVEGTYDGGGADVKGKLDGGGWPFHVGSASLTISPAFRENVVRILKASRMGSHTRKSFGSVAQSYTT